MRLKVDSRAGNADGTTPDATKYQVEVVGGGLLSVSFTEAAAAEGLDFVVDSLVEQLTASGAADVAITDRESTKVGDQPALDFRLSFTTRTRQRNIWHVRFIGDGTRAVQSQTIAVIDPKDSAAVVHTIEQYHRMLVDSVRLP